MKTLTFALAMFASLALPATAQDFAGRYSVAGTNINGTTYGGEAEISLTSDTTCEIKWNTGETESIGICSRNDDSFAAAYRMGEDIGLVIYKILPDGTLNGLWTVAGEGGNGTEILTPIR